MDPQKARLYKKIRQGKAVLFLGAGASKSAGAPLGKDLSAKICEEFFPGEPCASADLIEVCSKVLDSPGIDRITLEEFVRKELDHQPSTSHKSLCRTRWQAIFTTNFDDLVETAYRVSPDRLQRCEPCFGRVFSRSQSDYIEVVRLFKLMGCVTGRDEHSRMALSRSDYNRKLRQRGPLLKLLYDFIKDGTVIYAGYSFKDNIARDIIDEVIDEVGMDRLPWGWALLPECDPDTESYLRQRRILPLPLSFEAFMADLDQTPSEGSTDAGNGSVTLTVLGVPVEIPQRDVTMYDRNFFFLHDQTGVRTSDATDETGAKRRFLEGGIDPWVGIRSGWAFRRSVEPALRAKLLEHLNNPHDREAPVVLLLGPAGSGKTTTARMTAYDIYRSAGIPCIFLYPNKSQIDFLVIDSFVRQLSADVEKRQTATRLVPILLVVDEAAEKLHDLRRLTQYLISRGLPSVVLAVSRENEWRIAQQDRPLRVANTIPLDDRLQIQSNEPQDLLKHLRRLGLHASAQEEDYWVHRIKSEWNGSFQAALYYLAEPTRPPLAQSIRNEFDRLGMVAQLAYRYVSVFFQFGISIDLELLARSLGCSYEDFMDSVYDPASIGVIVDEEEQRGVIRFRGRSRMVCERIVEYCYRMREDWLADLAVIISSVLPQNASELDTVRRLLILKMGPRGAQPVGDVGQLKNIFERVLDVGIKDSALLHHFALLLLDCEDFAGADHYLSEALTVVNDEGQFVHFKTEPRHNLFNSMGMVAGRRGLKLQLAGNESEATEQFEHARELFRTARIGATSSAYPHYCDAFISYSRSRNAVGDRKLPHLAAALKSLDEAACNVPDEDKSSLEEMEAKILQYIGSGIPNWSQLLDTAVSVGNADAEYLRVRVSLRGLEKSQLQAAYDLVREALARNSSHLGCLRLASRLHHRIFADDWEGWLALLYRWEVAEEWPEQCGLLFDLGHALCQLQRYSEAAKYFEKLDQVSAGHPRRSGIIVKLMDGSSERRFSGVVRSVSGPGEGWVKCEALGWDVKFVPIKQKFTVTKDQPVSFSVGLNYRGLLAIELRPAI